MSNTVVQLRNLATGQLAGSTTSNVAGQFSFIGLNPGNYAVEVVNAAGQIVGTSASVAVSAGAAVTGVSVTASPLAAAAAGAGVAGAGAAPRPVRAQRPSSARLRLRPVSRGRFHERDRKPLAVVRSRSARAAFVAAVPFFPFPF
jgi:hypothetical protein